MAVSIRNFLAELYQEYLEEASFLYSQRLNLLNGPEISWLDIEAFENRFEAHIDGLIVGEGQALEICKQRAAEGDSGELHAAVRVFCRQDRKDLFLESLDGLDPDDDEKMAALCDALKCELPENWHGDLGAMLTSGDMKLIRLAAVVLGYRRMDAGEDLIRVLRERASIPPAEVVWALGRLKEREAGSPLFSILATPGDSDRYDTALSLLRIGEQKALDKCLGLIESEDWVYIPIGLAGGRSAVKPLLEAASMDGPSGDCLIALGLLGDISAVEMLLPKLSDERFAESAALALDLITGAQLYEEAFIPEEIDEDELFEPELEAYRKGEPPLRPDGRPYGTTVKRLSQNPDDWAEWWVRNKPGFSPDLRYRKGAPYAPATLLQSIAHPESPYALRQLAYEELVIRYGVDFAFEANMPVAQQKNIIPDMQRWTASASGRFKDGVWYFAGRGLAS